MRFDSAFVVVSLAMGIVAGCSSAHEAFGDSGPVVGDSGPIVYDAGPVSDAAAGEPCGPTTCGAGTTCCNASCGICTPPGTGCIDLFCESVDAGPAPHYCGGLEGAVCAPSEYCDFPDGAYCGGADAQGLCRARPTACLDPGGVPVCGCDGVDYLAECSAYFAGTDVAHFGSCSTPPPAHGVAAMRSCGPADGPAWIFTITDGAPVCAGIPTSASLSIDVWYALETAAPGTVYTIGSSFSSQGSAAYCPSGGGGPPCFTLTGTLTLDAFHEGVSASFSYDLVDFHGTHYTGSHASVALWCPGAPLCG